MGSMQLSRSQIYEMIWSKPIQQVAPTLGLSDVGLAKLCKRYDIPRPPRGYWAKLQHGQAPPKSPLPDPGRDPRVRFEDAGQNASDRSTPEFDRIRVTYPIPEGASHPLVAKARSHFERLEPNKTGLLVPRKHCPLDVRVSPAQLDRALAVVDALLCAFESRGERVEAGPSVVVGGYRFGFEVREELEEAEEPLEPDLSGEYEFHHRRKKVVERLSGVLCLQITGGGSAAKGMQRSYRDSQRMPLEGRLESIASSIPRAIARDRNRQIREAAEQREIAAKAEGMAAAGTPEIMSKVNALMERVSALEEASAKIANRVDSQLAKSMQQLDEGLSGKIRSELSATQQALAKELTGAIRPLSDEISAANGRIDSLETSARQAAGRQKLILGLLVVGILGIVAAVAVPLLGLGQNAG